MSEADKMLMGLGFKREQTKSYVRFYNRVRVDEQITFDKENKTLTIENIRFDRGSMRYDCISMWIFRAINKKIEELGWIKI